MYSIRLDNVVVEDFCVGKGSGSDTAGIGREDLVTQKIMYEQYPYHS